MKNGKLFKQFASVGLGSIINMAIGLLTTPIITRLVDPSDYGQLSLFNTYANITMMIVGLGFDQVLLRYYYQTEDISYKQRLLSKCLFLPVLIFCILSIPGALIYYLTGHITDGKELFVFLMFLIEVMCLLINRISILLVRLNGKANLYSMLSVIQKITYVAVAIPLILIIKREFFVILVFATFLSYFTPTIISIVTERKVWRFKFTDENPAIPYKELLKYGLPMLLSSSIYLFFQATDKICLNYFCDYVDVGIYASAASLMSIIAIVRTSFTAVWTPAAVEHYERQPNDKSFFIHINQIITLLMFVFGLSLMVSKDLIVLLLGQKYREASIILPYLMFQPIMYTISETTVVGLIFTKKSNMQLVASAGACIFNLVLNICLIPILGAKGASISTGVSYIVFYMLRTVLSNHYFPVGYRQDKFILATITAIAYAIFSSFTSFSMWTVPLYIVCLIILSVLYKDVLSELVKILGNKLRR